MRKEKTVVKRMKKGMVMFGVTASLLLTPMTVFAEQVDGEEEYVEIVPEDSVIQPQSISTSVRPMLSITDGTAKSSAYITSGSTCKISLTMKLQKKTSSGWRTSRTDMKRQKKFR